MNKTLIVRRKLVLHRIVVEHACDTWGYRFPLMVKLCDIISNDCIELFKSECLQHRSFLQ